jgi:hypothetical protein
LRESEIYFTKRYPGFDLEEEDWPDFRRRLDRVSDLLNRVKARCGSAK